MKRHLTLAATLCLLFAEAAVADLTRIELSDPQSPAELEVEIEWGSIRILGDPAAATVTVEARPDRPDEVTGSLITASEDSNQVRVEQAPVRSGTFRSANLEIRAPFETHVSLRVNRGGDIRVQGVRGFLEVTNLNGSVELVEVSGAAAVNASNGAIAASFAEVDPDHEMLFASLNGSVELCLPPSYSGRLHLETAGDPIRSDFQIEREPMVRTVAPGETLTAKTSEVQGRIGSSESRLWVSTLNGEIWLARCR